MNLAILEQVERVWASFSQLENALYFQACLVQHRRRAGGGNDFKAQFGKLPGHGDSVFLVGVADADEDATAQRQRRVRGHL